MQLAEIEVYHSRPVAPTRRVAVGRLILPIDEPPGFGGMLLGAVVAKYSQMLSEDMWTELEELTYQVERGERIPQPRLRHRFQKDRIGLSLSVHQVVRRSDNKLSFVFEKEHEAPAQNVLAAVYAAGTLDRSVRPAVMEVIRRGIGWQGDPESSDHLLAHLSRNYSRFAISAASHNDPIEWALEVLGFDLAERQPQAGDVQSRFRKALRSAHPDFGGESDGAADRIADITEARRILLP